MSCAPEPETKTLSSSLSTESPAPEEPQAPPEPLEDLIHRIRYRLRYVLRSYDIPQQDAEDLLQDSFLEAFRKWDTIRNKEGWLLGALRVMCSNYWKRQRSEPVQGMDMPVLEGLCEPLMPDQEKREAAHDAENLLRGIDPRHREALWLRYAMGYNPEEVAERLGYCASSIRKLTLRAAARVREAAGAVDPADPDPGR